jgi:hypothetical protein
MKKNNLININILFITTFLLFSFNALSFEKFNLDEIDPYENVIIEDLYEPLKVTGNALPWQLFSQTKEIEDCTIDKDGFDYCLIKPVYNKNIKKYNGKTVTLMGYMFPLEQSEKQKKFLLGPYPLSCPFHYHVGPSQVIEINSDQAIDFSFDPVTLKGELRVKFNKETGIFYYLELKAS